MTCRAGIAVVLVVAAALGGAGPAVSDPAPSVSSYYVARADPRLCPSPMCGGIWARLVNTSGERYAASADLSGLGVVDEAALQRLIAEGRAVARGRLAKGRVQGFPELDTLVVSEVWIAGSSPNRVRGTFHRLRDRGIRCVTTPCFSVHAARLNSARHVNLSDVDLSRAGAPATAQRRALSRMEEEGLIVAGRVVVEPNAGPAGTGRSLLATQFYERRG